MVPSFGLSGRAETLSIFKGRSDCEFLTHLLTKCRFLAKKITNNSRRADFRAADLHGRGDQSLRFGAPERVRGMRIPTPGRVQTFSRRLVITCSVAQRR
jgi:hypothetical protein